LERKVFFHYERQKAVRVLAVQDDWSAAIESFESAKGDILSGVDCYALGHANASVFMMMRVLEKGLKALAVDVGETFDRQNWHNIIDLIESKISHLQKTLRSGTDRDERLSFLSSAAKEFRYFKDGWRNYVAHGHKDYDTPQAESGMNHVRDFMNHLAIRLRE
jgi:hypothetical protein